MADEIGRPVRVVSLCFQDGSKSREEVAAVVDAEGARGCDLIALPESWPGHDPESLDGPTVRLMAALAKQHRTYIVCPIDRWDGKRRLNSAILLDRQGEIVCVYDKVYPYWCEFDYEPPVMVGEQAPVYATDFGRVGMAICFDANFPEVWRQLADQGAELVIWPSAYSAGSSLQAHAINHHYYIVTSTATRHCLVYDITGELLQSERAADLLVSRITLDLDRGIYHQNFNMEGRERLLCEQHHAVTEDRWLDDEQWFVLRATRPGVSARTLARRYGLEELRDYLDRSRREIDKKRGWAFGASSLPPLQTQRVGR
jgi:predicted amidohydrolase